MKNWIIASILLLPVAAWADISTSVADPLLLSPDGAHEVSVSLGGFHPTAKFGFRNVAGDKGERYGATGYAFILDYLRNVNRALGLGLEFAYLHRGEYATTNVFAGNSVTRVRGDSTVMMATARVRAPGTGWRPYGMGGVGFHKSHMDLFGTSDASFTPESVRIEDALIKGDATGIAYMARAGVERAYSNGSFVGLDVGYYRLESKRYPVTNLGQTNGYQPVDSAGDGMTYSLKLGIRFGTGS